MKPVLENCNYGGWNNAVRMKRESWELVAPLEVGPRILRLAPVDGQNLFYEDGDQLGMTGGKDWRIYGGHRFWTAPENEDSYAPDNEPVSLEPVGSDGFRLIGKPNEKSGWQKDLAVTWQESGLIHVEHRLTNLRSEPLSLVPWCLSVLAAGGTAYVPQPPYQPHPSEVPAGQKFSMTDFLPNRHLILWPFTDLTDPRIALREKCWTLEQRAGGRALKIGFRHTAGWIGYLLGDLFFAKYIHHDPLASYPDRGSNAELFTNQDILEVESLAPDRSLAGHGITIHSEWWQVGRVSFAPQDHDAVLDYLRTLPVPV